MSSKKTTPKKKPVTKKSATKKLIAPVPSKRTLLCRISTNETLQVFGHGYMIGATVWTTLNLLITFTKLIYWSITH